MDWWVNKQLRAFVMTELHGYLDLSGFENPPDNLKVSSSLKNSRHYSRELEWAHCAWIAGKKLFFMPAPGMSAR